MKTIRLHIGRATRVLGRCLLALALMAPLWLCAPASAQDAEIFALQSRIDAAAASLKGEKRLKQYSDTRRQDITRFVAGNMMFVLMHEMGHALIHEMGLPVLGREEDAADSFASVSMLWMKNEFSDRVLAEAVKGWFYSDRRDRAENSPIVFYEAHSLSRQRAYQIVCYMVGSDPKKFAYLADETSLPEDRRDSCEGDFSNAEWSWEKVLKDHKRTTQPKTDIAVQYDDPGERFEIFARVFKSIQLLETIARCASDRFVWRAPIKIEAKVCGMPSAEWNIPTRTLTVCYEMAEEFATLWSSYANASVALWQP